MVINDRHCYVKIVLMLIKAICSHKPPRQVKFPVAVCVEVECASEWDEELCYVYV